LKKIHFELKKGQTLGIVGYTGSGKTALIRLLLREYDLRSDNVIKLNGVDIKDLKIENLREKFGYVPQDNFLFSTTIRNNIAFTDPSIDINKIHKAAELSYIHEDIMNYKDGYETGVIERCVSLSGGQKQRIAIARTLIQKPAILILDVSLSAVYGETEAASLTALNQERKGKAKIIPAH